MKITITTEIGAEGRNCWRCAFAPSFSFCDLFRVKLKRPEGLAVFERCVACLAAEHKQCERDRSMGLNPHPSIPRPNITPMPQHSRPYCAKDKP